jgi:hypothetical protein
VIYSVTIHNSGLAVPAAYVYCVFWPDLSCAYVGQTCGWGGAIGRLSQHVAETGSNTFRQRVCRIFHFETLDLEGAVIEFAAVRLSDRKSFNQPGADYREAVESIVQAELVNRITDRRLVIPVVSVTRPNAYNALKYVQEEARDAVGTIFSWLVERSTQCSPTVAVTRQRR